MFLELVDEQKIYTNIQLKVNGNAKKEVEEEKVEIKEIKEEVKIKEVEEEVEVKKIVKPKKRPRGKR